MPAAHCLGVARGSQLRLRGLDVGWRLPGAQHVLAFWCLLGPPARIEEPDRGWTREFAVG
ncbi:MAG: hypothetical protein OXB91_07345 [Bryobacterales bacterium]|nr:hypothetical protein [Bryobacterales bacterium]